MAKLSIRPQDEVTLTIGVGGAAQGVNVRVYIDDLLAYEQPAATGNINIARHFSVGKHKIRAVVNEDFNIAEGYYLNNELVKEIKVATQEPDVLVSSFDYSHEKILLGEPVWIKAVLQNVGGENSVGNVEFYVDSILLESVPINVAYNDEKIVSIDWLSTPGRHNLRISALFAGDINLSNNVIESEIYSCAGASVLIISDNDAKSYTTNNPENVSEISEILKNHDYCVGTWSEVKDGIPSIGYLNKFDALVWSSGDYWNGVVSENDFALLSDYNGSVLFEGSDFAFDANDDAFLESVTKAGFERDIILDGNNSRLLLKSHKLLEGITGLDLNADLSPFPDGIFPVTGASLADWNSGESAITFSDVNGQRRAFIAFSIDAILDGSARERLVSNIANWLTRPNTAPSLLPIDAHTGYAWEHFNLAVNASDAENDRLEFSDDTSLFDINKDTGVISFMPSAADSGTHTIRIAVSDGFLSSEQTFTLTINTFISAPYIPLSQTPQNVPSQGGEVPPGGRDYAEP